MNIGARNELLSNLVETLHHGTRVVDLKRRQAKQRQRFGQQTQRDATVCSAHVDADHIRQLREMTVKGKESHALRVAGLTLSP